MYISGRIMTASPTVKMTISLRYMSEQESLSRAKVTGEVSDGIVSKKGQLGQEESVTKNTGPGENPRYSEE